MKKILSLLVFSFLLVGAAQAQEAPLDQLLGVWTTSPIENVTLTYRFFEDNTFEWETESPGNKMSMEGTYVVEQKDGKQHVVFSGFTGEEFAGMVIVTLYEFLDADSFKMDGRQFMEGEIGDYPQEFTNETLVFQRVKTE